MEILYFKNIYEEGYIDSVSKGQGTDNIQKDEYDNLLEVFKTTPPAEEGFGYKLKTDLTWEKYELPVVPDDAPIEE